MDELPQWVRVVTAASSIGLLVFLFPLALSPGPGNVFFAGIGAARGLRAAIPALAGYRVATLVVTVAVGLGMGATVLRHPTVATILAALGSVYVLWLAWQFFRSARKAQTSGPARVVRNVGFWSGAVVLLLNPKAYYIHDAIGSLSRAIPPRSIAAVQRIAIPLTDLSASIDASAIVAVLEETKKTVIERADSVAGLGKSLRESTR